MTNQVEQVEQEEQVEQVAMAVTPEMLLAQIVGMIGEEFVVIPISGWAEIFTAVKPFLEDGTIELSDIPVIPVSLAKKEESRIILPNDTPTGDSNIIL